MLNLPSASWRDSATLRFRQVMCKDIIHCRGLMMTMKSIGIGSLIGLLTVTSAGAAGWSSVHKYVKRTGNCAGQEVLASHYSSGTRTASGERFDASGNTAAARTWPLG